MVPVTFLALLRSYVCRTYHQPFSLLQVDVYYLREYLWRFVEEERLLNFLLEEVVSSAMDRCVEPVTMEPSVIMLLTEPS